MDAATLSLIMSIEGQIAAPEAELLYLRASEATVCIVEIGSFRGRSTVALALGSKAGHNVPVYAIDPHEQTSDTEYPYGPADRVAFMRNVVEAGVADIVRMVNLPSDALSNYECRAIEVCDLVFIDGDHSEEVVLQDAMNWADILISGGSMLLHDKHAESVQRAARMVVDGHGKCHRLEDVEGIIQLCKERNLR